MSRSRGCKSGAALIASIGLIALASATAWAKDAKLVSRPLSAQEVKDYSLAATTQKSAGLFTVGVGEALYLEAQADTGTALTGVTWTLSSKPSGSTAQLADSPLGTNVPINLADRAVRLLAGRKLLVPDKAGQYTVTARIGRSIGDTTLTQNITAATYVGVGTVGGATPVFPQCATCHADQASEWAETNHASILEEGVNGIASDHYSERCVSCHSVGYNTAATAVNNGFDDVLKQTTWGTTAAQARGDTVGNFFKVLQEGNFEIMPAQLQAKANIQCENCHGAGSEHKGDPSKISVSLSAGNCGYCHDSLNHHFRNREWGNSKHAVATRYPSGAGRGGCVICHTGAGFIERLDKGLDITDPTYASQVTNTAYVEITCAACHDPHDASNPNQLRTLEDVTLMNGVVVSEGGKGKLCMNCHKSRRNAVEYVKQYASHFGPHYSLQTDMLAGTNAVEYGQRIRKSTHLFAVEDACATCHMQAVEPHSLDNPAFTHVGNHTFKIAWDGGTPDDPDDDIELTEACAGCHGPMESFNIPKEDYDGDGRVEGVQTEVEGLLHTLALALPPDGPTVVVTQDYTPKQLAAAYNYLFVEEDGSRGIHNVQYAVGILRASIQNLTGRAVGSLAQVRRRLPPSANPRGLTVGAMAKPVPLTYGLGQNYPNPFNPETEISYAVPEPVEVRLEIYNALGQRVRTLVDASHGPGEYTVRWDGTDNSGQRLTAGVYFYVMQAGTFAERKKMVFLQ